MGLAQIMKVFMLKVQKPFSLLLLWTCLAFGASAQVAQEPVGSTNAKGAAVTLDLQGRITALDHAQQRAIVTGPKGNALEVFWGEDVSNAAQMAVGDTVNLRYERALLIGMNKIDGQGPATREVLSQEARSQAGDKPGSMKARTVRLRTHIVALDAHRNSLMLQGAEHTLELMALKPELLRKFKVGDRVEAIYHEALLVQVTR